MKSVFSEKPKGLATLLKFTGRQGRKYYRSYLVYQSFLLSLPLSSFSFTCRSPYGSQRCPWIPGLRWPWWHRLLSRLNCRRTPFHHAWWRLLNNIEELWIFLETIHDICNIILLNWRRYLKYFIYYNWSQNINCINFSVKTDSWIVL